MRQTKKMNRFKIILLFCSSFVLAGCVLPVRQDVLDVNSQISDLRKDMSKKIDNNTKLNGDAKDEIIKQLAENAKVNNEIKDEIQKLAKITADLRFNIDTQNENIDKISSKVDDGNSRFKDMQFKQESLDNISKRLSLIEDKLFKLAISTTPISVASPEQIYNMARSEYSRDNYSLAIAGFEQLIQNYPDTKFAENACYDLAVAYFFRKNWQKVCELVDIFTTKYPANELNSKAYLLKAKSLKKMGKIDGMQYICRIILKNYPLSEEAKIAKDELDLANNQ